MAIHRTLLSISRLESTLDCFASPFGSKNGKIKEQIEKQVKLWFYKLPVAGVENSAVTLEQGKKVWKITAVPCYKCFS